LVFAILEKSTYTKLCVEPARPPVVLLPIEPLATPDPELALQKGIALQNDLADLTETESSGITISRAKFPAEYKKRISALNNSLRRAARLLEEDKLGDNIQKDAWQSYLLCSKALLKSPKDIPMDVWTLLWDVFEKPNEKNYGRLEHLFRLGNDMEVDNTYCTSKLDSRRGTKRLQSWTGKVSNRH